MTETAVQPSEAPQTERRFEPRYRAEDMPSITSIRLSPLGIEAKMVDISTTGILVECGTRIQPSSNVSVTFDSDSSLGTVSGRVARTTVAALDQSGSLRYHVGIAFSAPIALKPPVAPAVSAAPATSASAATSNAKPVSSPAAAPAPSAQPMSQPQPVLRNRW